MNLESKIVIAIIVLLSVLIIQAVRVVNFSKKNMSPDLDFVKTLINILKPHAAPGFKGHMNNPMVHYFNLITGRTLTLLNSFNEKMNTMTQEEYDEFDKKLDQDINLVTNFIKPNITTPSIRLSEGLEEYYENVKVYVENLECDLIDNTKNNHITKQYLLYCKRNNLDPMDMLETLKLMASGLDEAYILNEIKNKGV